MATFNALGAVIPGPNGEVTAPPGQYWNTPNTLAEIPNSAIGQAAGNTTAAYTKAALGGLFGSGSSPISSLQSAAGLGGAGTTGVGGVLSGGTAGSPGGASTGGIAPIDLSQAQSAAFGAAKDTAGKIGQSSIESLKNALGAEGMLGGGAEVQGTRDIVENAAGQLGDVNRANAEQAVQTNLDVAKANQNAAITQRGQDIQQQEAQAQLALSAAQFNAENSLNMLKLALGSATGGGILGSLY